MILIFIVTALPAVDIYSILFKLKKIILQIAFPPVSPEIWV